MKIDKQTAIERATALLVTIYPNAELIRTKETGNLREFAGTDHLSELEGRSGWCVEFHVDDDLFEPYDRPILVDGETGEVTVVKLLL